MSSELTWRNQGEEPGIGGGGGGGGASGPGAVGVPGTGEPGDDGAPGLRGNTPRVTHPAGRPRTADAFAIAPRQARF